MALSFAMMTAALLPPISVWGQESCDPTKVGKLEKEFHKTIKGGRKYNGRYTRTHGGATIAFQIAQCHANVNDSLYSYWLEVAIEREKIGYAHGYAIAPRNTAIRDIGLYYYLLRDMEQAEIWVNKYLMVAPHEPLAHYRHGMVLLDLQRYADALVAFNKSLELGGDMPDLHELIDRCRLGSGIGE